MALKCKVVTRSAGSIVITLNGSLDTKTYGDFEKTVEQVLKSPVNILIIDLEGLDYVSTMGINALLKAKQAAEKCNGEFLIINVQPSIQRIFDIIKVIPDMSIFSSLAEADEYFASIQRQIKDKDKEK